MAMISNLFYLLHQCRAKIIVEIEKTNLSCSVTEILIFLLRHDPFNIAADTIVQFSLNFFLKSHLWVGGCYGSKGDCLGINTLEYFFQ